MFCFHVRKVPSIDYTCFLCTQSLQGINFFSLVLILHIRAYLGIKGDHFFSDLVFFLCSFYIQIGVLQFESHVQFYAKLNVLNLYVMNLYQFQFKLIEYNLNSQIVLDQFILKLIQICDIKIRYIQFRVKIGQFCVKLDR